MTVYAIQPGSRVGNYVERPAVPTHADVAASCDSPERPMEGPFMRLQLLFEPGLYATERRAGYVLSIGDVTFEM
jgi:hypothetical protein